MAKNPPSRKKSAPRIKRTEPVIAGGPAVAASAPAPKKRVSPAQFVRNVRSEMSKVSWPTRRETMITTMMVFIMVTLLAIFFFVVDQILSYGISRILGLGA